MVFVCVDKNRAVPGRFFQSLPVPYGAGDKQGRGRAGARQGMAGQGRAARAAAVGGRARCHFYSRNPWGEPGDLHLIKQKYNFFKKNLFIIEHIRKTRIF
jgi:hypothetical protein